MSDSLLSSGESNTPPADPVFDRTAPRTGRAERLDCTHETTPGISPSNPPIGNHQPPNDGNQIPTPSRWNETVLSEQYSSERQTAMLRFRYQIAPWLDANAPRSKFGPEMMTLAAQNPVIMEVIIWVAMRRSRKSSSSTDHDGESHRVVHQLSHRLALEDELVADVGQSLLALGNFFHTCPSEWPGLYVGFRDLRERCQFFRSQKEPLRTLDRFHFKTGTSILSLGREMRADIDEQRSPRLF